MLVAVEGRFFFFFFHFLLSNIDIQAVNFTQLDRSNLNSGDPVISFGIAALHPEEDTEFQQVFKRAKKAMVENKKLWREL